MNWPTAQAPSSVMLFLQPRARVGYPLSQAIGEGSRIIQTKVQKGVEDRQSRIEGMGLSFVIPVAPKNWGGNFNFTNPLNSLQPLSLCVVAKPAQAFPPRHTIVHISFQLPKCLQECKQSINSKNSQKPIN